MWDALNFPRNSSNIKVAENKSMNDETTKMRYFLQAGRLSVYQ